MTLLEIFLIGIGLSMDAFAVAICKGLAMPNKVDKKGALLIALYFGVFQAVMPTLGWLLGSQFARYVTQMAPWIAFVLLAWIGGSMIRESLSKEEREEEETGSVSHKELLVLAVATSIDALAVGVTFSSFPYQDAGVHPDYHWRPCYLEVPVYHGTPRPLWGITARITMDVVAHLR